MAEKDRYWMIYETNGWEGETWKHYFLDEPGVKEALGVGPFMCAWLRGPKLVELTTEAAEALANEEPGYLEPHWFGRLTDAAGLKAASEDDLYKGGIRKFAEPIMESVVAEPSPVAGERGTENGEEA